VFHDEIDASNLGYAGKKSVVSWSGIFNATVARGLRPCSR